MIQKSIGAVAVVLALCASYYLGSQQAPPISSPLSESTEQYSIKDGRVFFYSQPLINADPATFEQLEYGYARDENRVFYDGRTLHGADPETFAVMGFLMARDKNYVYTFDRIEDALDPSRIEFLGNFYSRQGDAIFYKGRQTSADAATFTVLTYESGGRDANNYYLRGRVATPDDNEYEFLTVGE